MIVDAAGRPIAPPRTAASPRLSAGEGRDSPPESNAPGSKENHVSDLEGTYVLRNGLRVDRSYFYTGRDRTAYPGVGGLLFIERVSDRYLVIEDNVVVDMASSLKEAECLVADFHHSVAKEQEERHQAELDRLSHRSHAARRNTRSWPSN